jgi:hypothetical protein
MPLDSLLINKELSKLFLAAQTYLSGIKTRAVLSFFKWGSRTPASLLLLPPHEFFRGQERCVVWRSRFAGKLLTALIQISTHTMESTAGIVCYSNMNLQLKHMEPAACNPVKNM